MIVDPPRLGGLGPVGLLFELQAVEHATPSARATQCLRSIVRILRHLSAVGWFNGDLRAARDN